MTTIKKPLTKEEKKELLRSKIENAKKRLRNLEKRETSEQKKIRTRMLILIGAHYCKGKEIDKEFQKLGLSLVEKKKG